MFRFALLPSLRKTTIFRRAAKTGGACPNIVRRMVRQMSSLPREIHVTYGNHKRMVPVTSNDSASFRKSFVQVFHDVIPPKAKMFQFQRYQEDVDDFVDLKEGENIEYVRKSRAFVLVSVAIEAGDVCKLWSLTSNKGNGYLSRAGDKVVTSGSGDSEHCEWLVQEGKQIDGVNYYKFLNKDKTQVLCISSNKEIKIKKPSEVSEYSDNFVPDPFYKNMLYTVLKPYNTREEKLYLGSDGRGNVKLVKMANTEENPTAEALFVLHRVDKASN